MGRLARVGDVAPLSRAGPLRGASHRFVTGRLAQFRSEGHLARLRCRGTSRVRCGVPRTGSLRGQLRSAPSRASPHGPSASTGRRSHPRAIPSASTGRPPVSSGQPVRAHRQPVPTHRQPLAPLGRAHPHPRGIRSGGGLCTLLELLSKTIGSTERPRVRSQAAQQFVSRVQGTPGEPSAPSAARASRASSLRRYRRPAPRTACHPHVHQTHQLPRPSGLPAPLGAFSLGGNKLFRSSAARRRAPSGRVASPRRTSRTDAHA